MSNRYRNTIYGQPYPKRWFNMSDSMRRLRRTLKTRGMVSTIFSEPQGELEPWVATTIGLYQNAGLPELLIACSIDKETLLQALHHCAAALLRHRPNLLAAKLRGYIDVDFFRLSFASGDQVERAVPIVHRYYGSKPIPMLQVTFEQDGHRYGDAAFTPPDPRFSPIVFGQAT